VTVEAAVTGSFPCQSLAMLMSLYCHGEESPTERWLLWGESHNFPSLEKYIIPVLCFQTLTEISDEKVLLRASGEQQKQCLHLLLEMGGSLTLRVAPAQSHGAALVSLGTLCSLAVPW